MTREEKIKGLYSLKEYLVENPIELEGHKSLPITLIDYAIQSLEQDPKTGHWIKIVVNSQHKIKCDKCDYIEPEYITHIRNYCPNCGARMESEDNNA